MVYGEQVHVPCLIRLPHDRDAAVRRHELVQPPDLCASLCESFQLAADAGPRWGQSLLSLASSESPTWRDRAATLTPAVQSLRTPAWLLVRQHNGGIAVRTAPSLGTSWRIFLPAADASPEAKVPQPITGPAAPAPTSELPEP